jgi:hypothetical protein
MTEIRTAPEKLLADLNDDDLIALADETPNTGTFRAKLSSLRAFIAASLTVVGTLPAGGTTGQIPVKSSNDDYEVEWADIPEGGITDAPTDGEPYVRVNGNWSQLPDYPEAGIADAPSDGKLYGRKDGAWSEVKFPYRFTGFFAATPAANEVLLLHPVSDAITLPLNLAGSRFSVGTNPSANTVLSVNRNGAGIGTITVSAAGAVTVALAAVAIAAGDLISIVAPAASNGLANFAYTIKAS